ncbi:hypothetical protein Tco_1102319 [Tanacetum coccineum]
MADNRTMAQLLEAPTEGYEDAIVVPEITANNFEIKHGLLNLVQINKANFLDMKRRPMLTFDIQQDHSYDDSSQSRVTSVKLMLLPFSLEGRPPDFA